MTTTETTSKRGPKPKNTSRDALIREERKAGAKLAAIGAKYGVTRQRVCQIVNENA